MRLRYGALAVAVAAAAIPNMLLAASQGSTNSDAASLEVLSSRPEFVSGGDALIRATVPPGRGEFTIKVGNRDVTAGFVETAPGVYLGRIGNMSLGENTITLNAGKGAGLTKTLKVTSYPITGPMFSGPHEQPFFCQTDQFRIYTGGPFLEGTVAPACHLAPRAIYLYRATNGSFKAYPTAGPEPADMTETTTNEGKTVRYIVRLETGTVNRSIYQTAMLHDPVREPAVPSFHRRSAGWNGRLVYTFGGGCTGGWYRQGNSTGGVLDHNILKQGYAMASSSLNVFGNNCQDLTAAESMAMVKERFIEVYGLPRYTIGWGCSGGSYQQHQIADNYPGLLDGILPGCSFPEVFFATVHSITDMRLLGNYFNKNPGYTALQQREVAGVVTDRTIYTGAVYDGAMRIAPNTFCPGILPVSERYHPVTNPHGARCDVYQHTVNVFGADPATGFANRPLDNVGIQYGLKALNQGVISVDQFLDINEKVGGYDRDANFVAQRTVANGYAMQQAYQTGRLTNGGGGLKEIPIIDYRGYQDDTPGGDIHLRYHSFSMRERLIKANGDAKNQVMLAEWRHFGGYSSSSPLLMQALAQMDQWIANIQADTANISKRDKVIRNRPATLVEGCMNREGTSFIAEELQQDSGQCAAIYPAPGSPRFVAGASIASDIIKCQLKPIDMRDYAVAFSPAQAARLSSVFPAGVCDWSRPGVEQQGLRGTWLKF